MSGNRAHGWDPLPELERRGAQGGWQRWLEYTLRPVTHILPGVISGPYVKNQSINVKKKRVKHLARNASSLIHNVCPCPFLEGLAHTVSDKMTPEEIQSLGWRLRQPDHG